MPVERDDIDASLNFAIRTDDADAELRLYMDGAAEDDGVDPVVKDDPESSPGISSEIGGGSDGTPVVGKLYDDGGPLMRGRREVVDEGVRTPDSVMFEE